MAVASLLRLLLPVRVCHLISNSRWWLRASLILASDIWLLLPFVALNCFGASGVTRLAPEIGPSMTRLLKAACRQDINVKVT